MDNCPDCQAAPGHPHHAGCDVARCARTGIQRLMCDHDDCNTLWTGQWPGTAECAEYGWWIVENPEGGWIPCTADTDDAQPDLNRLNDPAHAHWDPNAHRYVKN